MHAIVMAGGKGSRLGALTRNLPKPLMKMGDHSILGIITQQLRRAGFDRLTFCVSHFGELVERDFGNGERFGVAIDYCWDRDPLGTAAPLRLVPEWTSPALVMNGDILTSTDFGDLFAAHQRHRPIMTVAVRRTRIPVAYGVLDLDEDGRVSGIREKPRINVDFSSGMYVIDPAVRAYIPAGHHMDMPALIAAVIDRGERVRGHQVLGPWHDIGTPGGYHTAARAFLADPGGYVTADPDPVQNARPA